MLAVKTAFHSKYMDSIEKPMNKALKKISIGAAKGCVSISSVTGVPFESKTSGAYWFSNVRNQVKFWYVLATSGIVY